MVPFSHCLLIPGKHQTEQFLEKDVVWIMREAFAAAERDQGFEEGAGVRWRL